MNLASARALAAPAADVTPAAAGCRPQDLQTDALAPADFVAALLDPARAVPAGLRAWNGSDPARRFAIHRNNVAAALAEALAQTFPVVRQLVGDAFFDAMAGVFWRTHPPRSPVLARYGAGFADWLETFAPARPLRWLPDMARLEHARVEAWQAADAVPLAPAEIAPIAADTTALAAARPRLHPSVRVLRSAFAVGRLWSLHQQPGGGPPVRMDEPCGLIVLRDPADDVLVLPVDPPSAAFCAALGDGASFAEALLRSPGLDPTLALTLLVRHGGIVGWRTGPQAP